LAALSCGPACRRGALELLASCPNGGTEAFMLAHGFTIEVLVELVRGGLATAQTERVGALVHHSGEILFGGLPFDGR
jgi:hypothetical protein